MIAIIDYGAGNIHSIEKALQHVGAVVQVTDDPKVVAERRSCGAARRWFGRSGDGAHGRARIG